VSGGGQAMNQLCKVGILKVGAPKQKLRNWKGLDKRESLMEYAYQKQNPYGH
jgi:hypothetical protein